ncbi:MAG: T9SS type A sorting domain-containing protein [Chitinophagales bacterium]|nr:T9SS type A sorting domain-containing protein [Chitinophagales bacterium]
MLKVGNCKFDVWCLWFIVCGLYLGKAQAQDMGEKHCRVYYPKTQLEQANAESVKRFVVQFLPHTANHNSGVLWKYQTESPGGFHYAFVQTFCGIEVYQSEIKINVDRKGVVRSVLDNSYHTNNWRPISELHSPDVVVALRKGEEQPLLCQKVVVGHAELIYYGDELIHQQDLRSFATDSLVSGKIFNPDPLTTAQQTYGGIFKDNGDANAPWLDNVQQTVNFRTAFNGGFFSLANDYITIMDFDTPQIIPVTTTVPFFNYNRSQSGFEDVNAFYHLNTYRQHLNLLGFNLAENILWVDPHAVSGADNSYFSYSTTPPRIYFGIGGVDDAEDADVIIHEYGHFLSYNAAPQTNFGNQRNALDEGLGDYMAASYSKAINTFGSTNIFNWDGHNEFWNGRVVNTQKKYPTDITTSIYRNGEMWSTALMNIHDEIGRAATDSLIFQTHYGYSMNMNMDDAAYLMIEADTMLTGGKYFCSIFKHLYAQGFLPFFANNPCGISSISDAYEQLAVFSSNAQSFTLRANTSLAHVRIFTIAGKLAEQISIAQNEFTYTTPQLAPGVYIVQALAGNRQQSFRWIKTE